MEDSNNKKHKKVRFDKNEEIRKRQKAENTNKLTRLWMNCFNEYLEAKGQPNVNAIPTEDLPKILEQFYLEIHKRRKTLMIQIVQNVQISTLTLLLNR